MRNKILIVDDIAINREILVAILEEKYECLEADSGKSALKQIDEHISEISLVLLDLMMPDIDGFMVLETLKNAGINIPVIIITANSDVKQEKRGLSLGAVDFISKPFEPDIVKFRVETHVRLKLYQDHLEELVEQGIEKAAEMWASTTQAMAEIIEYRSHISGQHIKRTSMLTRMLLLQMNKNSKLGYCCTPKEVRLIYEAASLHDIGKIGISDNILFKPDKLTEAEYEEMKKHARLGYEMAVKINEYSSWDYMNFCCQIALCHHERWDGTGYPEGLKGTDIPLSARVVALADAYDAITNARSYKSAGSHESAVKEIKQMSGKQFDPYLVEVFLQIEPEIKNTFENLKKENKTNL